MRVARTTLTLAAFPLVAQGADLGRGRRRIKTALPRSLGLDNNANRPLSDLVQQHQESTVACRSDEPDVGILAVCGENRYCSSEGLCVDDHRQLQTVDFVDVCTNATVIEAYNCDCSGFDTATALGIVNCDYTIDYGCFPYNSGEACLSAQVILNLDFGNSYSYTYCYNLTGDGLPYNKLCVTNGYDTTVGILCGVSVDGTDCLSAECAEGNCPDGANYNSVGFDCTNTNKGSALATCAGTLQEAFPVLIALADAVPPPTAPPGPSPTTGSTPTTATSPTGSTPTTATSPTGSTPTDPAPTPTSGEPAPTPASAATVISSSLVAGTAAMVWAAWN